MHFLSPENANTMILTQSRLQIGSDIIELKYKQWFCRINKICILELGCGLVKNDVKIIKPDHVQYDLSRLHD